MSIEDNINKITTQLPQGVRLVAVSKFHPVEKLREAYNAGQRLFGENHAQEMVQKQPQLPADVEWHMIGHLQTNKVRMIMPHVKMIQSVDSIKLLKTIEKEAARIEREVDVLLQVHVAQEETKSGFSVDELLNAATQGQLEGYPHVHIAGLMAMATNTPDMRQVAHEFGMVRHAYEILKQEFFTQPGFKELSMGMSHDWKVAVDQGSTMVRIGTDIFGPREY